MAVKPAPYKDVTREQRQPELFGAVLPTMGRANEWKKDFMTFVRESLSDRLLVLMTRVQRVPVAGDIRISRFRAAFH